MADLTIALDSMGGDLGPHVVVQAVKDALMIRQDIHFILLGQQTLLDPLLAKYRLQYHPNLTLMHCSDVIAMDEKPTAALRGFRDSSMRRALELVADDRADACISAGNTGALMALSKHILGLLPGIIRPALVKAIPHATGQSYLLDLGANVDVDAKTLFQFAVMGVAVAKAEGVESPRVALLSNGLEVTKGTEAVRNCAKLLSQAEQINYIGYLEGDALFSGIADIIVCDGFVGNVALKSCEGLARLFLSKHQSSYPLTWIERMLSRYRHNKFAQNAVRFEPDQYNGATLLGVRGIVVKSHGSARQDAFCQAIHQAAAEIQGQLTTQIMDQFKWVRIDDEYN